MAAPTHYEVLGVSTAASQEEIKKSFRDLARKHHPDVSPGKNSEDLFRRINAAYQVLSDANKRLLYDSELKLLSLKTPRPQPGPTSSQRTSSTPKGQDSTQSKPSQQAGQSSRTGQRPSPIDDLLDLATTALRKMRYREAEMLCRQILRMDRRNVTAYEILGDVHKARGRTDEAVAMYSYVLQLDRSNASVRAKFDRLVGNPSGPTMAGHAASASRHSVNRRYGDGSLAQSAVTKGLISLVGAAILAIIVILTAGAQSEAPRSFNLLEWDIRLIGCLAAAGGISGTILSLNGILGRFRDEMAVTPRRNRGAPVPLGIVLVGFAALSLYASLLAYLIVAGVRRSMSKAIVTAYGSSLGWLVLLALVLPASAAHLLAAGGNIVFLAFVVGWLTGDAILRA